MRIHFPSLTTLLVKLAAIAGLVQQYPEVIHAVAGRAAVGILTGASIVQAVQQGVVQVRAAGSSASSSSSSSAATSSATP